MNECVCIYTHRVFIGMWGLRESVDIREFGEAGIQGSSRTSELEQNRATVFASAAALL